MSLINFKAEISLKWIGNRVLTTAGANADATGADSAILEITDAKHYVPVVTLLAEDNIKLVKQLNEGFKRRFYWNKYKLIDNKLVQIAYADAEKENCLIEVIKELKDCLLLFMIIQHVMIKFLLILLKNISIRELKLKVTTLKLMEEIFMISQLMTGLSNTTKSEKYQKEGVMITRLLVY